MQPVFPYLSVLRTRANLPLRQFSADIGISHSYLSTLEDFAIVPNPDDYPVIYQSTANMIDILTRSQQYHYYGSHKMDLMVDYLFYSMRNYWGNLLNSTLGPVADVIRCLYFVDEIRPDMLYFLLPREGMEADIIDISFLRYFSPDGFRRRRGKGWKKIPPLYNKKTDFTIEMTGDHVNSKDIFHKHPQSDKFIMLIFYTLLQNFTISPMKPIHTECKPEDLIYLRRYEYYAKFKNTDKKCDIHAHFQLLPPHSGYTYGLCGSEQRFAKTFNNTIVNICLPRIYNSTDWCWCFSSKEIW